MNEHSFPTSVGTVQVVVHEASRIVSISRLGAEGRPVASTMCDWDTTDLAQTLAGMKIPAAEAREIAAHVQSEHAGLAFPPAQPTQFVPPLQTSQPASRLEHAGLGRRFAAVMLDALIIFFPVGFLLGLMNGPVHAEQANGSASSSGTLDTDVLLFFVFLSVCYYTLAEGMTGTSVGKRILGLRVVEEDGADLRFGAAFVRNILRPIDSLFFCLVGAIFAATSSRGQRIGDRAAHTVVVRR